MPVIHDVDHPLVTAFGFAWAMRTSLFSIRLPSIPKSAQAAMVSREMTAQAAQGRHLFLMNCAHCHGDDARGDEGPDLHDLRRSDARVHQVITGGIKGEMPPFAKKLGEPEIRVDSLLANAKELRNCRESSSSAWPASGQSPLPRV
jgi:mono/diheme cytochrome c family protein